MNYKSNIMEVDFKPSIREENENFEAFRERRKKRNIEVKKTLTPTLLSPSANRINYVRPKK